MIRSTFQLVPGIGPGRERALWAAGFKDWLQVRGAGAKELPVPAVLLPALMETIDTLETAWSNRDLQTLATLIPQSEHWRLFGAFPDSAVYLDIETDREEGVTVVGVLDDKGPKLLMAGRSLDDVKLAAHVPANCLLITFNGSSFDVPVLRKEFLNWLPPVAHMDLRHVWTKLGHWGGLKALEDAQGIGRPKHIKDLDGSHASWLWRHARLGDRDALLKLAEYNLYDTVNLRTLAAIGFNKMLEKHGFEEHSIPVSYRGDVLYDVSQLLLSL